ncbi:methyl-accepting chemotaxis protein, partial [Helicobacter muridarum]
MFFSKLSIGAKVSLIISLSVIVSILCLSFFIIKFSADELKQQNAKILNQASSRYINLLSETATEMYTAMLIGSTIINTEVQKDNIKNTDYILDSIASLPNNVLTFNWIYLYIPKININSEQKEIVVVTRNDGNKGTKSYSFIEDRSILQFEDVQKAFRDNKPSLSKPRRINFQNQDMFVQGLSLPIRDKDGKVIGVLGCLVDFNIVGKPFLDKEATVYPNDQRFMIDNEGIIAINKNQSYLGSKLDEISPTQYSKDILAAAREGRGGIFPYVTSSGINSTVEMKSLEVIKGSGQYWNIITLIPNNIISQIINKLVYIILILSLMSISFIILITIFFMRKSVSIQVTNIGKALSECFKYLNHETNQPPALVKIKSQDELGRMAEAINSNIQRTQKSLEQDSNAVA